MLIELNPPENPITPRGGQPQEVTGRDLVLPENYGTVFWGPYNKDPTIAPKP